MISEQPDLFHPTFDPKVQPITRNTDPQTSADAAASLNRQTRDLHCFILRHHLDHQDTDRNAGEALVAAGFVDCSGNVDRPITDWEEGRRASRWIREELGWTEYFLGDDGKPAVTPNNSTGKKGQRNRLTRDGWQALLNMGAA